MNRSIFNRAMPASSFLTHLMDGNAIDPKKVSSATKFIGTDSVKLQDKIHATAVACLHLSLSIEEGGPATGAKPFLDLLNVLPKSQRTEKLARWAAEYSNIRVRWDKKAKKFEGGVLDSKAKTYATPRLNEALANPFWDMGKDERETVDFTTDKLAARIAALITTCKAENAKLDAKGKRALADLEKLYADRLEAAE